MRPNRLWVVSGLLIALLPAPAIRGDTAPELRFRIHLSDSVTASPLTGRLFLLISDNFEESPHPRPKFSGYTFRMDFEGLRPGGSVEMDAGTMGAQNPSLADIPDGDYVVQAVAHVYTRFSRSDGHTVWLPAIQWVPGSYRKKPGNLHSNPIKLKLNSQEGYAHDIVISEILPDVPIPADTDLVRRVKIQSKALTDFWGRPVYIGAVVKLPKGYEEHPDTHYPVQYLHGWGGLGNDGLRQGKPLYEQWMSDEFPRMISVRAYMPAHFFANGHAVNSANMGPWGDAFMDELVPFLETEFRVIREPWARTLSGGSTGGWIVLALQLFHPEFFGGPKGGSVPEDCSYC